MVPAIKITWPTLALVLLAVARADDVTRSRCTHFSQHVLEANHRITLFLERCNLTDISTSDLEGLSTVTHVLIARNDIQSLDSSVFSALPKTIYLDVSYNQLTTLPVFGKSSVLPEVVVIDVSHNNISKLDDPKTFNSTKKLSTLNLNNNQIGFIYSDMFLGLDKLESIDLQNNKLTNIDDKTYSIQSLNFVHLENNFIENVAAGSFRGSHLLGLYLEGNKLTKLSEDLFTGPGATLLYFCYEGNPWRPEELVKFRTRQIERKVSCPSVH